MLDQCSSIWESPQISLTLYHQLSEISPAISEIVVDGKYHYPSKVFARSCCCPVSFSFSLRLFKIAQGRILSPSFKQAVCVTRFDQSECVICRVIFALGKSRFQSCIRRNFRFICNFDTIPPWKVVGTLYLDSSHVTFKYNAFLSVWDKFELFGHVQAATMIWVLFERWKFLANTYIS